MQDDPLDALLPCPRSLTRLDGRLSLAEGLRIGPGEDLLSGTRKLLERALHDRGLRTTNTAPTLTFHRAPKLGTETHRLIVDPRGVRIEHGCPRAALQAAATLAQLVGEARPAPGGDLTSPSLPCLAIEDRPSLARRGIMLDVSRDRVPTMSTLERLVELFAGWKLNELQLYMEHTFAYAGHEDVWRGKDPLTPDEIRSLDRTCAEFGIELIPNQQCFGHLHRWLSLPRYRPLAECPGGVEHPFSSSTEPFSLCPDDPGALALLDDLFAQLLPCFRSSEVHVGLDETFDLGQGRSAARCTEHGVGRVHVDFLRAIHERVRAHGKRMWFWADVLLNHPEVLPDLPPDVVACSWGYEAAHDFDDELGRLAATGVAHVACPGTTSWKSFVGRPRNMHANVRNAARAAERHGSLGLLMTDWGDQGHLQPLPASYFGWATAADQAWRPNAEETRADDPERTFAAVDRDAFDGRSGWARTLYAWGEIAEAMGAIPNATVPFQVALRPHVYPPENATPAPTRDTFTNALAALSEHPLVPAKTPAPRAQDELHYDELTWARAALELSCRLGLARAEAPTLTIPELSPDARGPLARELRELLAEHQRLWPARTRPGGLADSCSWLELLLGLLE